MKHLSVTDLRSKEFRRRIRIGIEGRYVNKSIDIILRYGFNDSLRSFHVNVLEVEIPRVRAEVTVLNNSVNLGRILCRIIPTD